MHDALRELRVGAGARVASYDFGRGPDGGSRGSGEVQTDYLKNVSYVPSRSQGVVEGGWAFWGWGWSIGKG